MPTKACASLIPLLARYLGAPVGQWPASSAAKFTDYPASFRDGQALGSQIESSTSGRGHSEAHLLCDQDRPL